MPDLGLSTVRKGSTSEMWFVPPPPVRRQNRQARRVRRRGRPLVRPLAVILLIASFWLALAVTAKVDPTPQLAAEQLAAARRSVVAANTLISPVLTPEAEAATLEIYSPPTRSFALAPVRAAAPAPTSFVIVKTTSSRTITSAPGRGRVLGTLPTRSRWITSPLPVWVMEISKSGRYGKIAVPWSPSHSTGWIDLRGLSRTRTRYEVIVSLSHRRLSVYRSNRLVFSAPTAIGAPASPTPPGSYFVTDRSPWNAASSFGSFIFGLSGVQTNLPAGWGGGNLLAIHGTNNPASIGLASSAGCLRVSRATLERLEAVLVLGAPVIVKR